MTTQSSDVKFLQDYDHPDQNNNSYTGNTSAEVTTEKPNVNDALFDQNVRIIVLYIEVIVGAIGGFLVCCWLWANRRRKSRVNKLILHVTISDLLVVFCACLPQLIWEYDREWRAGEPFCKILKYLMGFSMMSSSYMVVILSVDRHEAIMYPLRNPLTVWKMALIGWVTAAVLSIPQMVVFHLNYVTNPGPFYHKTLCESIFRTTPPWVRPTYLTFISQVVFFIPFVVIVVCYVRIFVKISGKVSEMKNAPTKQQQAQRPGKIFLQSSQSTAMSKAKVKILKMTVVIVATFAICGLPYHVLEMIYSFGDHTKVAPWIASVTGGMAVAYSAVNPFVFLAFNATRNCVSSIIPCINLRPREAISVYESNVSTRTEYPTAMTDITRLNSNLANKDGVNTPTKPVHINAKKNVTYHRVDSDDINEGF